MSLFREMRRRNVYRVGAAYVIVGWLIIQIAVNIFPNLQLPEWTVTLVTALVALGFPVALLLAWAFELTPDGIRLSQTSDARTATGSGTPLDYALIAGLVLVAGALLVSQFRGGPDGGPAGGDSGTVLIAVMDFEDQSPEGGYAWLGQGIPTELRTALGRIDGIEVAPQSFEFSFDDSEAVAVVDFVVEGSIRSDGEALRVSASLTHVDGRRTEPMLQQDYYEASENFTIQEDLAERVLSLIGVRLGVQDVNAFAGAGTKDPEAYENYLRGLDSIGPAVAEFMREAVNIDPDYANAWAQLALSLTSRKWFADRPSEMLPLTAEGLEYALRAHELQPDSAEVLAMLGTMYYGSNDWTQGYEYHLRAIGISRSAVALGQNGALLYRAGKSSDALRRADESVEASTLQSGNSTFQRAVMLMQLRRYDEARALLSGMSLEERLDAELMLSLSTGKTEDVRQSVSAMVSNSVAGLQNFEPGEAASRLYEPLLAVFDDTDAALSFLRQLHAEQESWPSRWHDIGRLAAWFGDTEFALELVAEEARNGSPRRFGLWMPYMAEVRALPEFEQLVEEINLVGFWESYGWGDFCRGTAGDFSCS